MTKYIDNMAVALEDLYYEATQVTNDEQMARMCVHVKPYRLFDSETGELVRCPAATDDGPSDIQEYVGATYESINCIEAEKHVQYRGRSVYADRG